MIAVRNTNEDLADALKHAIMMRLANTIDTTEDNLLGLIIYNIARWSVADRARASLGNEDLICDIQLHLLQTLPKVDTSKSGRAMFAYLKRAADNKIISMHRADSRQKRTGILVDITDVSLATDFYGRQIVQ